MAEIPAPAGGSLLLGIDTCGPSGSVALGRVELGGVGSGAVQILGERELEGRSYSATLISAISELLASSQVALKDISCLVAVHGPGSFTGVRVGLSAAKGLAEAAGLPVVAVSRLEVLAFKAGADSAALDAHRHEVFLRVAADRELLAGAENLAAISPIPGCIAICDDPASALIAAAWPGALQIRTAAPTAADALRCALPRVLAAQFEDVALLDGHYLRRSDAEIFGAEILANPVPAHAKTA